MSAFELRQALNSAGYRLNNHILNILFHRYGAADGTITFDDFMMCAIRMKTMIGKLPFPHFILLDLNFLSFKYVYLAIRSVHGERPR